MSILAQTFYIYISNITSFASWNSLIYCEYMLQNLTDAFCVNRLLTLIRMNFIASPPSKLSLSCFITSLWLLSLWMRKTPIKIYRCFSLFLYIQLFEFFANLFLLIFLKDTDISLIFPFDTPKFLLLLIHLAFYTKFGIKSIDYSILLLILYKNLLLLHMSLYLLSLHQPI